jgi:hypothetical protein
MDGSKDMIAAIHCQRGDSLDVDQIILEFE